MVDEADHAMRIEQDDAFLKRLKDVLEESFFADQAGDDLLDLAMFNAIQAGDEFFEEAGFHRKVGQRKDYLGGRYGRSSESDLHQVRIVFCTIPEVALARHIGTRLVEKQLAA